MNSDYYRDLEDVERERDQARAERDALANAAALLVALPMTDSDDSVVRTIVQARDEMRVVLAGVARHMVRDAEIEALRRLAWDSAAVARACIESAERELDEARAEVARLTARVVELERFLDKEERDQAVARADLYFRRVDPA